MLVRRLDTVLLLPQVVHLDAAEQTPEGFTLYDALFARTGNQEYDDGKGGTIIEHRPPGEVFHPDSLASYELRPLADLHPPRNIDSETARFLARGAVGKGRQHDDGRHVAGRLAVWDAELQRKFDAARRTGKPMQLSAGYTLDLDETGGYTSDGERYDAIQRNIRINHVAAVPLGRAGSARVLDGADALRDAWDMSQAHSLVDIAPNRNRVTIDMGRWCRHDAANLRIPKQTAQETTMKIKINIDGKDVELELADNATPAQIVEAVAKAHADAAKTRADAHAAELKKLREDAAEMFKKMGSKEEKEEEDKKKADEARRVELDKIRADADLRADVLGTAKAIIGIDYKADSKDADAIRLDVIGSVLGEETRKDAEADKGAIGYLYNKAVKDRAAAPRHADGLLAEIRRSRKPKGDEAKGDEAKNPITKARKDAERQAALPRHMRAKTG